MPVAAALRGTAGIREVRDARLRDMAAGDGIRDAARKAEVQGIVKGGRKERRGGVRRKFLTVQGNSPG